MIIQFYPNYKYNLLATHVLTADLFFLKYPKQMWSKNRNHESWIMSDDAEAYHNGWVSAFPSPDKKLLCSWHVDRWRRKVNELIKDKDQAEEVYAALKTLQNEI